MTAETQIRTFERPACPLCSTAGTRLYSGLKDFSYAAPGEWGFQVCPRKQCGTVWLDPVPLSEELGKAYTGYYTHSQPEPGGKMLRNAVWSVWHSYLGRRFGYRQGVGPSWLRVFAPLALLHPGGRDELDAAAMHLPAPNGAGRVLDVGCGSGVLLARMKSFGWAAQGVELDPAAVKAARARNVDVKLGTLEDQRFPENMFDAVHSAHVIEHLYDPLAMLRECYRILKPGGTLVILTPNAASLGHREFGDAWLGLDPPRHLLLFTPQSLESGARAAGFNIKQLDTTARNVWVYAALSHCIRETRRGEMSEIGKPGNILRGVRYQLRERWNLRRDWQAGEELRLIATKPAR